jgi:hypothetical protein
MKVARRTCFAFVLMASLSCVRDSLALADGLAVQYSSDELRERLGNLNDRLWAWSIEYQAASGDLPTYTHRTLAARFPDDCFYRGAKGRVTFDWRSDCIDSAWMNDAFQDIVWVSNGQGLWEEPKSRVFKQFGLGKNEPLPKKIRNELMFLALGWWPFEKRPPPTRPGGLPYVLRELASCLDYRVRDRQELRNDRWCHVLERSGYDSLWLDVERGCTLIAREVYSPGSESLVQRFEMSRHVEIYPDIWVPKRMTNAIYRDATSKSEKPVIESQIEIIAVRINEQVDDAMFAPRSPLPGALQITDNREYRQIAKGGFDYMDELALWALRHDVRVRNRSLRSEGEYGIIITAIALAVLRISRSWRPLRANTGRPDETIG